MLHVFDAVCNLANENDEVVSLVWPCVGDGPFNLVVPPVRFSDYVSPSSSALLRQRVLTIGHVAINTTTAANWNPQPNWQHLRKTPNLWRHIPTLFGILQRAAPTGSLAGLIVDLPPPDSPTDARVLDTALQPAQALVMGIATGDKAFCHAGASELAGLGGGLTPAGDDWILGCLLAAWVVHSPAHILQSIADAVLGCATTLLSLAWLKAAARGECSAAWHILLNKLSGDETIAVENAAFAVVQMGHTSGADALAGFVSVLMALFPSL